jgi:hypothetical protein
MHGGPAKPYRERDGKKGLKQKLEMESVIKNIYSCNLSAKRSARKCRCPGLKENTLRTWVERLKAG